MKTLEELDQFLESVERTGGYSDSQGRIEQLKKHLPDYKIRAHINKHIKERKSHNRKVEFARKKFREEHKLQSTSSLECALNYVTHKYKFDETVLVSRSGVLEFGTIKRLTAKGYKIFFGRKLGTIQMVPFSKIVCHANDTNKIAETYEQFIKDQLPRDIQKKITAWRVAKKV